ncbi:MAG: response regulator [Anaerolineae bacterium]|nr:response regulator [Anaerolineae bacterium]
MRNLLLVDDEPSFRRLIALTLQGAGYRVREVEDGVQALDALQESVPDLVVTDLSMPRLDGWEVVRWLRANPATAHTPVVVLTANTDDETHRRSQVEPINSFLLKPVSSQQLLDVVKRLL